MMKRNNLSDKMVAYYEGTYHGKVQELGYPAPVAGCGDCHTKHNILPKEDPRSSIHPDNLEASCGRCHTGFHARFLSYQAHPDYTDRAKYPALYVTFLFMGGASRRDARLLLGPHDPLVAEGLLGTRPHGKGGDRARPRRVATGEGLEQVERFSVKYRIMHVLLVLSFFTLVLTGFPLKYAGTEWAQTIIAPLGRRAHGGALPSRGGLPADRRDGLRQPRIPAFPLPQGRGQEGLARPAARPRLALPEPEGPPGLQGQ